MLSSSVLLGCFVMLCPQKLAGLYCHWPVIKTRLFSFLFQAIDEPPYLTVGTDVSAKYRGAFCEAKIKTAKRLVKVKVCGFPALFWGEKSHQCLKWHNMKLLHSLKTAKRLSFPWRLAVLSLK